MCKQFPRLSLGQPSKYIPQSLRDHYNRLVISVTSPGSLRAFFLETPMPGTFLLGCFVEIVRTQSRDGIFQTLGLYRDNGKENGNYRGYRDYIGII